MPIESMIRRFSEISINDVPLVGGKNASLGEMVRELSSKGVRLADGFAVTAEGYWRFLCESDLETKIRQLLSGLNTQDTSELQRRGLQIRHAILATALPQALAKQIVEAYHALGGAAGELDVAVRSSATAEDLPDASFAGQQETYLNVRGDASLLEMCKRSYASLFTDRAISYRADKGFDHFKVALSIGVQRMVRCDLAASGVMFSIDTESGFRDAVLINAAYGLGENVVQGAVNPDEFVVFKPTLKQGFLPILKRSLGSKEFKLIYDVGGGKMVKNVPVSQEDRNRYAITDSEVLQLSKWACQIEEHYSRKRGCDTPMDMEWGKDGITGELYVLQARPETVHSQGNKHRSESYHLKSKGTVLVTGRSVGEKIAAGPVKMIKDVQQLSKVQQGDVLVADKTDPDWEPSMKRAAAIVTNRGGRTCHAAIVSRELGLPAIVGTGSATEVLQEGQAVTVCCAEGEQGKVYEGKLEFVVEQLDLQTIPTTQTKVMLNVGNPDEAFRLSNLPCDGVGLARMEFIISNHIKVHPLALLDFETLADPNAKAEIAKLTAGYTTKSKYFIDRLAEGAAMIAAAFYPKDVILRMSDFKTNEYANLIGGKPYEPHEENPMIGFRGASRYYDPRYQRGFALECQAMKKVRDEMGLTNLKLMIPFCRTVAEGKRVLEELKKNGLSRGENGLEVYVMCEIPSNVILAEEFAAIFDGFSIGSNDLTQLLLGVDRDSEIVSHIFDERNDAVKKMIGQVIHVAREKGSKIGICGQAPSDYPEFAKMLVEMGIHSISVTPDALIRTKESVANIERTRPSKR